MGLLLKVIVSTAIKTIRIIKQLSNVQKEVLKEASM
jgi:hypothetical protein